MVPVMKIELVTIGNGVHGWKWEGEGCVVKGEERGSGISIHVKTDWFGPLLCNFVPYNQTLWGGGGC